MCRREFALSWILLFPWVTCSIQQAVAQQQSLSAVPLSPDQIAQLQAKAKAGDPDAQLRLGRAYDDGNGVPQNDQQAAKWYQAAAEQGNARAQNNLGLLFRFGRGVEQNKAEAVKWYRKAAKQKYATAMFNLGTAYFNGDGVGINDVEACAWFMLAEDFGDESAAEAVKRINEDKGNLKAEAYERVGEMFRKGDDLPQSYSDAVNWYREAAEIGLPRTKMQLASLLLQGQGAESNYPEVHRLCEKAAKMRYSPGIYCVGLLYQQGWGVARDLPQAAKWFSEAANMGNAAAMLRLGQMYWKGEGVKQDRIAAYQFVYLAATSDMIEAKQERENLEKELTPKELEKGKAKATKWAGQHHPYQPLVLSGKVPPGN